MVKDLIKSYISIILLELRKKKELTIYKKLADNMEDSTWRSQKITEY